MILRSGIDLVEIERLSGLESPLRERFLARVFTPTERAQAGEDACSLAGRFAAKEAVAKALGCGIGPVGWQEIEILRGESGEPVLLLHGAAQGMAAALGLTNWTLSITHTRGLAAAVAMAVGLPPAPPG